MTPWFPPDRPRVSACLLSWRRPDNLKPIVRQLRALAFVDEILVWNNDPSVRLDLPDDVRVLPAGRNRGCYGRFLCAREAANDVVYVQDDDVLVLNVPELFEAHLAHPHRVTHALSASHFERRERSHYGRRHSALLGWGAFFRKELLGVLDDVPETVRQGELFEREADKYFTLLLDRRHRTLKGRLRHLEGHSREGEALWREADHELFKARAIREALALGRRRAAAPLPVPFHVVIPCRDYAGYLGDAVGSILHSDDDYVVTIVDDASTDATPEMGRELADRHPHVGYLRNRRCRGPAAALNRAVAETDSLYVVRLDADDRLGPDYLYEAREALREGADVTNVDAVLFGERSARWEVPEEVSLPMLLQRNEVHCASAFRRSLWTRVGGFDEEIPGWEDYEFWVRAAAAGARIRRLAGDHFFYRQHGASRSTRTRSEEARLRRYIEEKHAEKYRRGSRRTA